MQSLVRNLNKFNHVTFTSCMLMSRKLSVGAHNLNPKQTALVLIEFQNEFATEGGKFYPAVKTVMEYSKMLDNSANTAEEARKMGCKILHAPIMFSPDFRELSSSPYGILANVRNSQGFVRGTWGADFEPTMKPHATDMIVLGKSGLCAFESTNLQFLLGQNHIKNVVLAGFLTNCCVESTMRAAYEKGFNVITLTDCVAATSLEEHEAAIKFTYPMFSKPMTSQQFLKHLKA